MLDPAAEQELRLRLIAMNIETACHCGLRHCRKIYPGRQVLNTWQDQRVIVRKVTIVAAQPAIVAVGCVVFPLCYAIVEKERHAVSQTRCNTADQRGYCLRQLGCEAVGKRRAKFDLYRANCTLQFLRCDIFRLDKGLAIVSHANLQNV